ncbi:MAG: asparaginase [Ilumatobacteraceae bacterium]|nr:asparaginase [Ilumatobacteraceae bacterium]
MSRADAFVPLAETTRSGAAESTHFGAVVALAADGSLAFAAGDASIDIYPRSSNKPIQALAMVRSGLDLPSDLLALVCASHDGTPMHIAGVRRILATARLPESALSNTPDLPLEDRARDDVLRAGGGRTSILQNCSGKHAGMLVTCAVNGWSLDGYLDPGHPLQQAIDATMPGVTEEPLGHVGVDGCGAPAHVMSLLGLARAFRNIGRGDAGAHEVAVADAMRAHPDMVGGAEREASHFMRAVPTLMAKDGAEAVLAMALADGRAVAVKIADGGSRACAPVAVEALRRLGVDTAAVAALVHEPILGHGHEVGTVSVLDGVFDKTR